MKIDLPLTTADAKRIGSKQGVVTVCIGLVIAQLIMIFLFSPTKNFVNKFFWFADVGFKLNIFIGVFIMLVSGYFFGQMAGVQILIKRRNSVLIGLLCGLAMLLTTAFFSGWTGFFQEGLRSVGTNSSRFEDYIYKPFVWISFGGLIPSMLVGIWCGAQIKRSGQRYSIQ
ncbi:MAG: hypothetical protein EOP45_21690 [Sphingobacteriaceae bacterium]|nr:MAG: hypothetical protein EOP45_21690 [Sphingobacteriaceae bacterium]